MATYYRPPGQNTARSVALTSWGSGILLTMWPTGTAYNFSAGALTPVVQNLLPSNPLGWVDVAADPSGNAWMLGYFGSAYKVAPNGTVANSWLLNPGSTFTGVTFTNGNAYFLQSNGNLYAVVGSGSLPVTGNFGEGATGFSGYGTKLYAVLPNSQHLGIMTLTSATAGTVTKVTTPMQFPANTAASASGVAVVGWNNAALASGATAMAVSPTGVYAAAVSSSANAVMLLTGTDPNWQQIRSVAGQGTPVDLSWASSGEQVIVTDTAHSEVSIYNLVSNALTFSANISTTGANHIDVTPDGLTALVTRTSANAIAVLTNTANTWSTHANITVANSPGPIVVLSATEAVAGYVPPSGIGGLMWLFLLNGNWGLETAITGLTFPVSGVCVDSSNIVYAVGTTGSGTFTGHLAAVTKNGIINTTTWTGRGDAVIWDQGQIAVIDSAN